MRAVSSAKVAIVVLSVVGRSAVFIKYSEGPNTLPCGTEAGFVAKIVMEKEMRVAVSSLIPRFQKMCGDEHAHQCH
jgi:hypothetical protein